jgi:GH25 family lysozyme M1 (1,4-beta-N-acetylmuramidase)
MHNRAMVAALVACGALLLGTLPLGRSVAAATPPPWPAVGHGDPSLPHSPQMLQMLAQGGRGAGLGAGYVSGIDIASYQHPGGAGIDWGQVAGAGYRFAYIKATEGNYYNNPYYGGDSAGAAGASVFHGAYHFAIPNGSDGGSQADMLLNSAGYVNDGRTLPPMLDMEWDPYSQNACYGLNTSQMVGWIAAFSARVQQRIGRLPVIYTAAGWWNQCTGGTSAFSANPLDIASWGTGSPQTPGWATWTFWQSTSAASVPGISGSVDADVFNGDVDALDAFVRGSGASGSPAAPKTVSWGANRLDVFVRGVDNALWHRAGDGNGWWQSGWEPLGGQIVGNPAVVSWGTGRLDVFVRGADNGLWHRAWTGTEWWPGGWEPLGGVLTSDPAVASWSPGRLDIFARGAGNGLWHKAWTGAQWWPDGWESLGGQLSSAPNVASWGPGRLDIVARGADNALWHTAWGGAQWDGWLGLGGSLASEPRVVAWGANRLDIFVRGADNALWHTDWNGAQWRPGIWEPLGGSLTSGPDAVSWGQGRLDIFARGVDNGLWHTDWDGTQWRPGGWEPQHGQLATEPDVATWGTGRVDVVVGGVDQAVWHTWWNGSSWPWETLGGQLGSSASVT